jgi:hypothetical protein
MSMKKEIIVPKSFDEITLKQYLDFTSTAEGLLDDGSMQSTLRTYKLVEIITGSTEEEIDDLSLEEMNVISHEVKQLIDNFTEFKKGSNHFNLEGVDYVVKDINNLDNGEYISLNLLKEQYGDDVRGLFPKMLAVLIRPGKMEYDSEKKEEIWTVEKFNRRDIMNLELRADLFLNKAKAGDVIPIVNFFLSGKEISV